MDYCGGKIERGTSNQVDCFFCARVSKLGGSGGSRKPTTNSPPKLIANETKLEKLSLPWRLLGVIRQMSSNDFGNCFSIKAKHSLVTWE